MSLFAKILGAPKRRILAVDDDPNVLSLLTEILRTAGYEVDAARDGLEGHALIQKRKYDLIVLDSRMPNIPGTELLRVIRAMPDGGTQAVIMLSGEDMVETMEKAFDLGVMEWVCKPFSPERFLQKVSSHLGAKK
jgi:two-component system sensor histidine kinase/response regulator